MTEVGIVESTERVLYALYKGADDLERLLDHAELDVAEFDFKGEYPAVLNRCLRKVRGLEKLPDVIEAALRDHPDHVGLKGLLDSLEFEKPTADKIADLVKNLGGLRVRLRSSRHLTRDELNKFDDALQQIFDQTELAESSRKDGDAGSGQWDDLNRALETCLQRFQLYCELLDTSAKTPRRRIPGAPDLRLPLATVAEDRMTLIEAKLQLFDAVNEVVRSSRSAD
jgi:hypothetical protein